MLDTVSFHINKGAVFNDIKMMLKWGVVSVYDIISTLGQSIEDIKKGDAPSDGNTYARKNGEWVKISSNSFGGVVSVEEEGFFVCDKNLNIGFQVTEDGCKGINLVNYKEE